MLFRSVKGPGQPSSGSRLQPKISLESGTGQQLNAQNQVITQTSGVVLWISGIGPPLEFDGFSDKRKLIV